MRNNFDYRQFKKLYARNLLISGTLVLLRLQLMRLLLVSYLLPLASDFHQMVILQKEIRGFKKRELNAMHGRVSLQL